MQALNTQLESTLAAKEEAAKEMRRRMDKELKDFEAELKEEFKQLQTAVNTKNEPH